MNIKIYIFFKFIILFSLMLLLSYFSVIVLPINDLLYQSYSEKLTTVQIEKVFAFQEKWRWISYALVPLLLLLKISLIASVLYIGTFFYSKVKVTFKQLFDAVIKAEFVFLLVSILKIVWFYFFQTNYTLEDLQYFYPLSALNIVGYQGLESWFIYPLQVLNLFELAYWLLLAYFIGKLAFTEKDKGKPMDLGFKIVASSYGSALLLWVVVVMFFTLNYS